MPIARNGEIDLAYDVEGNGPDLLLIAGTASTRALWGLVRPRLARSFRTIAFDNRDSGVSTLASAGYALSDLAADAAAVLDAAGAHRALVLGHSMGGAIAQEFALTYPERVSALLLVCTWARGDTYSKNVMALLDGLTASVSDDWTLLATILFVGSGIATLRDASLAEMTDAAMALGGLAPREALHRQWQLDLGVDTLARLNQLQMPVHVVWGSDDRLLPQPLAASMLAAIPGATQTRLDGCGHVPMTQAPDAFVDDVLAFYQRLPSDTST